jgi:hypothetical protein
MVPERADVPTLGDTEKLTAPDPIPLAPPVTLNHDAPLEAVHEQLVPVLTWKLPVPPDESNAAEGADRL